MSSPVISAFRSTGIHSLLIAAPPRSFCPPASFNAITAPAFRAFGIETPLPGTFRALPATIELWQFCSAE